MAIGGESARVDEKVSAQGTNKPFRSGEEQSVLPWRNGSARVQSTLQRLNSQHPFHDIKNV